MPSSTRFSLNVSSRRILSISVDASRSAERRTTGHWHCWISENKFRPSKLAACRLSAVKEIALRPSPSISRALSNISVKLECYNARMWHTWALPSSINGVTTRATGFGGGFGRPSGRVWLRYWRTITAPKNAAVFPQPVEAINIVGIRSRLCAQHSTWESRGPLDHWGSCCWMISHISVLPWGLSHENGTSSGVLEVLIMKVQLKGLNQIPCLSMMCSRLNHVPTTYAHYMWSENLKLIRFLALLQLYSYQ